MRFSFGLAGSERSVGNAGRKPGPVGAALARGPCRWGAVRGAETSRLQRRGWSGLRIFPLTRRDARVSLGGSLAVSDWHDPLSKYLTTVYIAPRSRRIVKIIILIDLKK